MHHAKSKRMNEHKEGIQQDAELRSTAIIHDRCGLCSVRQRLGSNLRALRLT